MRLLLVSDIHANPWALSAVEKDAGKVDAILCAGDIVNYGPDPVSAINWLRSQSVIAVRGNHDHAVAFNADPQASPAKRELALRMRDWTREQLSPEDEGTLVQLPRHRVWQWQGTAFSLYHATPADPLYDYRLIPSADDALVDQIIGSDIADVILLGHTHLPLLRKHGRSQIVNPGSVGQPLDGDPRASYAIWDDGHIELRRVQYDRDAAVRALGALSLPAAMRFELQKILLRGRAGD